jgi:hypothetical protein
MLNLLEFLGQVQAQVWVRDLVLVSGLLWGLVLALQELAQE